MRALLSDKVNNIQMIKAISRNAYFSSIGARAQKTEGEMGQNEFFANNIYILKCGLKKSKLFSLFLY